MELPPHTPTPAQQSLIDRLRGFLLAEPRVEAAWLSGSLGKGQGDAFSDVDILVLVGPGASSAISADLAHNLASVATPVLVNSLFGGRVINVVTDDWQRFDLSFAEGDEIMRYDAKAVRPLFNRGDRTPPTHPPADYRTTPETLARLVEEFLRVLGLAVVGLGRREYLLVLTGVDLLRRMTMDLMLEENRISPADRGGALHRNPFLSEAQRSLLEGIPPLMATHQSALEAQRYLASAFLPRAKRLAAEIGMVWPTAFEEATRTSLRLHLGLQFPN